jgi:hypothetical protein
MAANSVDSDQYVDGSIDPAHLAADAVTAAKLASDAVVNASIAANAAIAHSKLAALASGKILVGNGSNVATEVVVSGDIAIDNTGATEIQADSVTYDMMQDTSTANRLLGAASAGTIGEVQVVVGMMAANSVDSDQYVDASIDVAHMSANSVDSDQYVDGSIDTAHIANAQITVGKMAANSVDSDQYVDASIDVAHMSANSVDSDQYVDGSIDTAHIADNQVTGDKLSDDVTIAQDCVVTRDLTVGGDLLVSGDTVSVQTANLNVEDNFILLNSGSINTDVGIIFGGTHGTVNTGKALVWDHAANHGGGTDGRLAVKTTATATDIANNANAFAAGTTGYYLAGVFRGSTDDAATALADHEGNIRIENNELFMYF